MRLPIALGVTTNERAKTMTSSSGQNYWMSIDSLGDQSLETPQSESPDGSQPVSPESDSGWSRRSFLRAAGFGGAGAVVAGCSPAPIKKAIPFLVQPEEIVPGRAYYYASTCAGCSAGCGMMVKNRDGRPIKLEGFRGAGGTMDRSHPVSGGGLCSVGQASLLGLYDSKRFKNPQLKGKDSDYSKIDAELSSRFAAGKIWVLTATITSPSTRRRLEQFLAKHPGSEHVVYDEQSCSALLDAHDRAFGQRVLPRYRFERADVIVGVGCDFLGTWVSPVEFAAGYAKGREKNAGETAWHAQVEGTMSLTGTKADLRVVKTEREQIRLIGTLAGMLARRAGVSPPQGLPNAKPDANLKSLEAKLWGARGKSIVVSGVQHAGTQVAVAFINDLLGNYGQTLDIESPSFQRQGDDHGIQRLTSAMAAGGVETLIIHDLNPLYDLPDAAGFAKAMKSVGTVISTSSAPNETSAAATVICPEPHFLERWDDAIPVKGALCLTQPAISTTTLFKTRSFRDSLAAWAGDKTDDLAFRKAHLSKTVDWRAASHANFESFWSAAVHDGVVEMPSKVAPLGKFKSTALKGLSWPSAQAADGFEVILNEKVGMPSGRHAHNAWLQELPDPITKMSWGNAALFGVAAAAELRISDGDIVAIRTKDLVIEIPAKAQPGQHDDVISIAIGYGRSGTERFAKVGPDWIEARPTVAADGVVGVNAAPLAVWEDGLLRRTRMVTVEKTGRHIDFALSQTYDSIDLPANTAPGEDRRRNIVHETTTGALAAKGCDDHARHRGDVDLWTDDHANNLPHWGMAIDLNRCTGCSACVVACQVENNIPVVGHDEVRRRRDMHWIRIDRYYSGDPAKPEDVDVIHQPMMCHHCDNAPCETVCPVLATVHSEEGLNQQVYNRCVGTRYCANNCPYKVRRFNWFDYSREDRLQNMVLNPDIAVRSRGVMEKCSFCVQRIQAAKNESKRTGVEIFDGQIQPACVQTCPTEAIVFGDVKKADSAITKANADPLHFKVLEELNVKPSVGYRTLVRNRKVKGE